MTNTNLTKAKLTGAVIIFRPHTSDLYEMTRDGSHVMRLTPAGSSAFEPAWSPDGSRIAFVFNWSSLPGNGIYLMNADGSNVVHLIGNVGR